MLASLVSVNGGDTKRELGLNVASGVANVVLLDRRSIRMSNMSCERHLRCSRAALEDLFSLFLIG